MGNEEEKKDKCQGKGEMIKKQQFKLLFKLYIFYSDLVWYAHTWKILLSK